MIEKIGIICTDFGFGPVSKALYIIESFKKRRVNAKIVFYGGQYSCEYISQNTNIASINSRDLICQDQLECDIYINIMDTEILKIWKKDYPPIYFVDSISWMWDKPFENIDMLSKYYIQDYLVNYEKINVYKKYTNIMLIPPITEKFEEQNCEKDDFLLVNYSGLHNPYTNSIFFENYCYIVTICILEAAFQMYNEIKFSTNSYLAKKLNAYKSIWEKKYQIKLEFQFYSHQKFIRLIKKAKFVLTNAGITTTIELLHYNLVFAFLPATNYSQALILQIYKDFYKLQNLISFSDFDLQIGKWTDLPEEDGIEIVIETIDKILKFKKDDIKRYFVKMFSRSQKEIIANNKKLPLKIDECGQDKIVEDLQREYNL